MKNPHDHDYGHLLRTFLEKSEAGAPGAPSVSEVTARHRYWRSLRKKVSAGARIK